ncbi:hypothetical protein HDV06_004918 [Boothiomyces sp. JEL0866]|nr:hypothetical protein HDV06_004918 [Boothiomyces sp. JEL0866]
MQTIENPFNEKENVGIGKRTEKFTPAAKKTATPKVRTGKLALKDVNTPAVKKLGAKDVNTPLMPKKLTLKDLNTPARPKVLGMKNVNTPTFTSPATSKPREKIKHVPSTLAKIENNTKEDSAPEVEYCPPTAKDLEFIPHPDDIIDVSKLKKPIFNPYRKKDTQIFDRIMNDQAEFDDLNLYLEFPDIKPEEFKVDTTLNLEF